MARRSKPLKASPVFEKLNQERLTECRKTVQSARQAIEASKKLTEEAQELIRNLRSKRRKAG
jgi:hypothetical protein